MKKATHKICLFSLAVLIVLTGCAANYSQSSETDTNTLQSEESTSEDQVLEESILTEIMITAGETVLDGVLFDNYTARRFADMLPLTSELWNPADGFAKAFNLPSEIPDNNERTRNYELGSLAYWFEGPSIAIIHNDNRAQTVVPVVPIGKITSDVSIFADYGNNRETITIEKKKIKET